MFRRSFRRALILAAALTAAILTTAPATAADPPGAPMLRLETGMHTAAISRIDADAAGRLLATASDDKTVRLWALPEGRLLRVLRPPLGDGDEGKLYTVAVSPDGRWVATGGYTGSEEEDATSIYLFEAGNGRLVRRLGGLPDPIMHLTFSPDGRRLAAGLEESGIRVWDTGTWNEIATDTDYDSDSSGLTFAADGRLATTSGDGFVRLYDRDLKLRRKVQAPGGEEPSGIAFSPDGTRIAVGYNDTTRVDVLAAADLRSQIKPDTRGVDNGTLSSVAWSADGRFLYAAGEWANDNGTNPIRRWTEGGRGAATDLETGASTIMDLKPLPAGGVAFGSGDPTWGVFDAGGARVLGQTSVIADLRDNNAGFGLARDGARVRFSLEWGGKRPVLFDLAGRTLAASPKAPADLAPPRTDGLALTGWEDTAAPKLAGKPLALASGETSRSLAVAGDGKRFLLGTEWFLYLFDAAGRELWNRPGPSIAWAVNLSGDGRLGVAAYADGTVRWHRLKDGQELLALFAHKDGQRWVAWTPSGYYLASPGAEDLVGWHVNNGWDRAADFYGVGRFRERFNRPDVVERVLATLDEAEALKQADKAAEPTEATEATGEGTGATERRGLRPAADFKTALPPVVTVLFPEPGAAIAGRTLSVRYAVRSPSGEPVTAVRALVDGRPVERARGLKPEALPPPAAPNADSEATLEVPLPETCAVQARGLKATDGVAACEVRVSVLAETRHGVGEAASLTVRQSVQNASVQNASVQDNAPAPAMVPDVLKPKLYVLAVGVSTYAEPSLALGLAAKDARDFATALQGQQGRLYREVVTRTIVDGQATKDAILDGLDWLQKETTGRDVAVLFLAGHGVNDDSGDYYFLPTDATAESLRRRGLAYGEILKTLRSIAGKALFFVDTCHSGNLLGTAARRGGPVDIDRLANELSSAENGAVVFAASTGRQFSLEDPAWGNGAFTKALVEGLSGKASLVKGDGSVTVAELEAYVAERVKGLTGGRQTPTVAKPATVPNYPIAIGDRPDEKRP